MECDFKIIVTTDFQVRITISDPAGNNLLVVESHPFLYFHALTPIRATFKDKIGKIYGIELIGNDCIDLAELAAVGLTYDPYIMSNTEEIHFLSIMKTRLHQEVKRGALVKAISIGSQKKLFLEPMTKILE
jgi:hypothetical protein